MKPLVFETSVIHCRHRAREGAEVRNDCTRLHGFATGGLVLTLAVAFLLLTVGSPAHSRPLPKKDEPVQVEGNVQTLNDVRNEPFHWTGGQHLNPGDTSAEFAINVPSRKRLIVELVALNITLPPASQRLVAVMIVNGQHIYLPLQSQGVFPQGEIFSGTYPLKMRIDSSGKGNEIKFVFLRNTPHGDYARIAFASVNGYLVDL